MRKANTITREKELKKKKNNYYIIIYLNDVITGCAVQSMATTTICKWEINEHIDCNS